MAKTIHVIATSLYRDENVIVVQIIPKTHAPVILVGAVQLVPQQILTQEVSNVFVQNLDEGNIVKLNL
jgi:hypothetical protein